MAVRIVADSTADFTREQAEELQVTLVPLKVLFGEQEYFDGVDLDIDTFYKKLEQADKLPTTSQPSPDAFVKVFEEAKKAGDELVVVTLASTLSGTYQSAMLAKNIVEYDAIHIVDSMQATAAIQLLVRHAVQLRDEGMEAAKIAEILEQEKGRICIYALVDDLTYLKMGGRLPSAGAAVGSLLNLKPIVKVEHGEIKVAGVARGLNGAYGKLLKCIEADGGMDRTRDHMEAYAGSRENLDGLEAYLEKKADLKKTLAAPIGSVIGTHAGPGACGIAVYMLK